MCTFLDLCIVISSEGEVAFFPTVKVHEGSREAHNGTE